MKHKGPWLQRKDRGFENKYNYNGKEEMPFTGYLMFEARTYDPAIARFLEVDPISDQFPIYSTYNYAGNSPITNIDLWGLQPLSAVERQIERNNRDLLKGKKSKEEFHKTNKAVGQGGVAGLLMLVPDPTDVVLGAFIARAFGFFSKTKKVAKAVDKVDDVKKVPNPNGKKGGPDHQNKMKEVEEQMKEEGFDQIDNEVMVKTPEGEKSKRFIDVQGTNTSTGEVKRVQVGKQNQNGTPVARERRAIDDIEKADGNRPEFVPYNKN